MIHPHTELRFISDEMGYGVFAKKFLPKGTITWVQDIFDREFSDEEIRKMDPVHRELAETYCFRNSKGYHVLCWDNGRFVNHSFRSNCFTTPYNFEIAVRDIQAGEELTDDYGYLNISSPFKAMDEGTSRKMVYPDDILTFHKEWDAQLIETMPCVPKVQQDMKNLISDELWQQIEAIAAGQKQMDSILVCHFPGAVTTANGHRAKQRH